MRPDVCVVGGGSAGLGAAIASARAGANVFVVERQPQLGGTSTTGYVCNWEPGPGDPIAREIYTRLSKLPNAVGITSDHNPDRRKGPFGLWLITPGLSYGQTLRRTGLRPDEMHAVVFDPGKFAKVVADMLTETGRCRALLRTTFVKAETKGKRVVAILAESADGATLRIRAHVFIDCTGGAHLCRAAGCQTMLGPESHDRFQEPFAPKQAGTTLNAISLCYRVRKSEKPVRQAAPEPAVTRWPRSAHVSALPDGDLIVNPLALLPGRALLEMGYEKAMAAAKPIVQAQWRWLQGHPTFAGYEFGSFAPMLGIRESHRVVGECVLTQHDLTAGLSTQRHPDIVAIADHPMDVHGAGHGRVHGALKGPYGIPYRCLVPKGWTNLLVAGRCASFSHIAASSCRLSRTMMALGHAAGVAAAMAAKAGVPVGEIDVAALRKALGVPAPLGLTGAAPAAAAARPRGAWERRRILYNLDGCSCMAVKKECYKPGPITRADLHAIADELTEPESQVDTLLVCINCQVMYYPTKVGTMVGSLVSPEGRKKRSAWVTNLGAFYSKGVDPYAVVLARAKERGLEALLTFRMNDAHAGDRDSGIRSALWLGNPQYRLGYGLDFSHKEVRDDAFRRIREAVQRYDCDGIELDWQRFPTYFGKGQAKKHIPTLNQFVRGVRRVTNEVGKQRGRPMLLAVRVMRTLERARAVGLDPVTWAKEGLIDFLTVSRFLHNPEGVLAIGEYRQAIPDIPIYGSVEFGTASGKPATVAEYRREARKLWADGVDGIYLFNFFCSRGYGEKSWEPPFFLLKEFGDPKTIRP